MKRIIGIGLAVGLALAVGTQVVTAAPPTPKQTICHHAGNKLVELEVADQAADAGHLKHGDFQPQLWFADADSDGYGAGEGVRACEQPANTVPSGGDCAPDNAAVNPAAAETCNDSVDNDCDGEVDEGCAPEPPPGSHEVQVLLHCDPNSAVLATYGVGTHTLPWEVQRNISYIRFVGGTTGSVTLHHCDGRTMEVTTNLNLCSLQGGCCSTGRWNDSVCSITVR